MLVLTRKENQSIVIADNIIISIQRIVGGTVKLGIEAPKDIKIMRQEIVDKK